MANFRRSPNIKGYDPDEFVKLTPSKLEQLLGKAVGKEIANAKRILKHIKKLFEARYVGPKSSPKPR